MIKKINFQLNNKDGFEIDIDCRYEKRSKNIPLVIFCHGFKGFKDWGAFPYMMEKLAINGFAAVSFNFSHNGVSKENPVEFCRPELFAQNTFSKELDDLQAVINHFSGNAEKYNLDKNKIALIGHSRGGGVAIIKTSEDHRIKALAVLASVSSFNRYTDGQKRRWMEKGYTEVENTRTKQVMKLDYTLLEDIEKNSERLSITGAISKIRVPLLILHGKEDLAVKSVSAGEIYKNFPGNNAEMHIIENTGHTFGTVHPFNGTTKAFEQVLRLLIDFLKKSLNPEQ